MSILSFRLFIKLLLLSSSYEYIGSISKQSIPFVLESSPFSLKSKTIFAHTGDKFIRVTIA
jgi:hypothetical protein